MSGGIPKRNAKETWKHVHSVDSAQVYSCALGLMTSAYSFLSILSDLVNPGCPLALLVNIKNIRVYVCHVP